MEYTNPRMMAIFTQWPSGNKRVTATFAIEKNSRGERAIRKTTGAAKKSTYALRSRIVDGSDGRTYIAELTMYRFVRILQSNMMYDEENIHPGDPRYSRVLELFLDRK
jgi:hypothetical protein